jgi:hypothetical protein
MRSRCAVCFLLTLLSIAPAVFSQQYNSVPLGHTAYTIIEMGVLRGAILPPHSAKPWSEAIVRQKLRDMRNNSAGRLSAKEVETVIGVLDSFERKRGIDFQEGRSYSENRLGDSRMSFETGVGWTSDFSVQIPEMAIGTVNKGKLYIAGDMGEHFSWNFNILGGFFSVKRNYLGLRPDPLYVDPKYGPYDGNPNSEGHYYYYDVPAQSWSSVYSIPAYFPYSFTKEWEGAVFPPDDLGGYAAWPDKFAFGYEIISELNTSFFDNRLFMRFGRMRRDWGPGENGSSLFMNAQARPFMAFEGTAIPVSWLRFSFLTGVLEYLKQNNQWQDADPFQNMFSLALLEIDTGKYLHFDFGSATVWPKRLDLGYLFPTNSNFMYQNNLGDFDNLALFADLEFRLPGIFKLWGSFFVDEIRPDAGMSRFFRLDRNMYAYQAGIKANINWLPFGAFTMRYTKIEPYTYTHEYTETPWNRVPSDTAYLNNGESLGYYLPPNSDELLIRFESMIVPEASAHFQYQMIRHGAEYGYARVDGSSMGDKIVKDDYTEKYFLRDGAYQWNHVFRLGGSYSLKNRSLPLSLFAEAGIVLTRFTINGSAGAGNEGDYEAVDNAEYRSDTGFIFSLGFKLFP